MISMKIVPKSYYSDPPNKGKTVSDPTLLNRRCSKLNLIDLKTLMDSRIKVWGRLCGKAASNSKFWIILIVKSKFGEYKLFEIRYD